LTSGRKTAFKVRGRGRPQVLEADPEFDVFRRLHPSEIPPSVNALRGTGSLRVLLSENLPQPVREAAATLVRGLGPDSAAVIEAGKANLPLDEDSDVLIVGIPANRELLSAAEERGEFGARHFQLTDASGSDSGDAFFGVFDHPYHRDRVVALFLPLAPQNAEAVARKVPHYGKYSYLIFEGVDNRVKGVWPVRSSPLIHRWK